MSIIQKFHAAYSTQECTYVVIFFPVLIWFYWNTSAVNVSWNQNQQRMELGLFL